MDEIVARTTREHLMSIGLMRNIEDDLVVRGIEYTVQSHRQLDDAQIGPNVTSHRSGTHQNGATDLLAKNRQVTGSRSLTSCGDEMRSSSMRATNLPGRRKVATYCLRVPVSHTPVMKMCGIRRTASTKCVVAAWLATVSARLQLLPSCSIRPQLIRYAQRGGLP